MSQPEISRRQFCKWSSSLVLAGISTGVENALVLAREPAGALKERHTPRLILPASTRNGDHVPVALKMNHPMEAGHYIRRVEFLNKTDPIPSKGVFHPTPANGQTYFAFQARIDAGVSSMVAIAECNLHGTWSGRHQITIPAGQGGCATAGAPGRPAPAEEILPPQIRIPELVRRGRLAKGELAEIQVKFKHPSKTGLAYENNQFIQVEEPFYVASMQVFYGERLVSRYEMTAGLSDNPFLKFMLKLTEQKPLRVVFTNSRGRQFSAVTEVALS